MAGIFFDEYSERLRRLKRHQKTIYAFENAKARYLEWCEANMVDPEAIEPWQLEEYFASLPFKATTVKNHFVQVSAAYNYAVRRGVLGRNPAQLVELPKVPDPQPRVLTSKQLREMRDAATETGQELLFHLFAYTGMRQAEGTGLAWKNVDLENRTIDVLGKGGKRRLIPIHPALGEVLVAQEQDTWLFPGKRGNHLGETTLYFRLRKIHDTATFHDFRRTVASSLDANGVEEGLIFKIMGWARNTVFDKHYRTIAPERLQRAILNLYADDPL